MSKVLKVIGVVAGVVALVATGIGAVAGAAGFLGVSAATFTSIGAIAGVVAGVASIGTQLLARPPPARGSVTQVNISPDAPMPYVMGEGLVGGMVRHDTAWGATLNQVPNPYRFMPAVYSLGPILSITPYVDQAAVSSYYTGFLYTDTQLGAVTEATALAPQWAGTPGWDSTSKLSGKAAIGWSLLFDKDGKRFSSGVPELGAYGQWVKVYDPRLDSTRPGGSGAHRIDDETTWEWSENPALHAGSYAYGRYQESVRVFGMGLPDDGINWQVLTAWANTCDLNGWTIFGRIFEPGDRWANLVDICFAGGALPIFAGGLLSFHYAAPRVALDTATDADLSDDDASVTAMASYRDRLNGIVPKCISPSHNWELIDLEKVSVGTYVTEDGEDKTEVMPFNLVKNADQAAQLATYRLVDGRELQPIEITYGPRMFAYRPGECLELVHPELGLDTLAVILHRSFDPARMTVTFTMIGETAAKHAFALGQTGVPPATPGIGQTGEERDDIAAAAVTPVRGAYTLLSSNDDFPLSATDVEVFIDAFDAVLDDGREVSFPADSVASLASSTKFGLFWHLADEVYSVEAEPAAASMANSALAFIGWQATSNAIGVFPITDPPPAGFGGFGPRFYNEEPL